MKIEGDIHRSGYPINFIPVLLKPIKNEHIMSPFELKMIALFKKNKGKKKKGKKKKTKKKGGRKSKHNIKMARKFRRTRRKRGSGGDGTVREFTKPTCTDQQYYNPSSNKCVNYCVPGEKYYPSMGKCLGGGRRRRKRRRTKKRKSRRRKKRTRRRRRKKR